MPDVRVSQQHGIDRVATVVDGQDRQQRSHAEEEPSDDAALAVQMNKMIENVEEDEEDDDKMMQDEEMKSIMDEDGEEDESAEGGGDEAGRRGNLHLSLFGEIISGNLLPPPLPKEDNSSITQGKKIILLSKEILNS